MSIYSYDEEEGGGVSMKVHVLPENNYHVMFGRTVFGIKPEHLSELRAEGATTEGSAS